MLYRLPGQARARCESPDRGPGWCVSSQMVSRSDHLCRCDRDRCNRAVSRADAHLPDRIDHVHPGDDTAEDGVLLVQIVVVNEVDEELGTARVRASAAPRILPGKLVRDLAPVNLPMSTGHGFARRGPLPRISCPMIAAVSLDPDRVRRLRDEIKDVDRTGQDRTSRSRSMTAIP